MSFWAFQISKNLQNGNYFGRLQVAKNTHFNCRAFDNYNLRVLCCFALMWFKFGIIHNPFSGRVCGHHDLSFDVLVLF